MIPLGYSSVLKIVAAIITLALSAQMSFTLPRLDIPFTAQSLVVFILAGILKPKESFLAIFFYLMLGVLGLPFFAEGTSGIEKLSGSSGGFLYGFLVSALFISYLINKINLHLLNLMLIMVSATILLFICGLGHLTVLKGFDIAWQNGLLPFWKMALVKAGLAALFCFSWLSVKMDSQG